MPEQTINPLETVADVIQALQQLPKDAVILFAGDPEENHYVQLRSQVYIIDADQSANGKETILFAAHDTFQPETLEKK